MDATLARLAVAERIAPAWADLPGVAAVVVSGSTARGLADRWSDLEIGVYWHEPPSDAIRDQAIARLGASSTRRVSRPSAGGWFGVDNLQVDGFQVDVAMNTVAGIDALVASVVDHGDLRDDVVELLGMLAEVRPLHGRDVVERWQRRLVVDASLRSALVRHALQPLPAAPVQIDRVRDNPLRIVERQLSWARCGLRAVYPLGGRWFPGFKAALDRVDGLGSAPVGSRARICRGLAGPTPEACEVLLAWLDEVFAAADAAGIDVAAAHARLHAAGRGPADPADLVSVGVRTSTPS